MKTINFLQMKKINLLLISALVLVLGSCSIQKRTFRPGYHIEWKTSINKSSTHQIESPEVAILEESKAPVSTDKIENPLNTSEEIALTTPSSEEHAEITRAEKKRNKILNISRAEQKTSISNSITPSPSANVAIPDATAQQNENQSRLGSDQLIIEILLAIFIPPLGVWLHEDSITTNFWISLVLTLLFILPGSIFSVLVVLDLI